MRDSSKIWACKRNGRNIERHRCAWGDDDDDDGGGGGGGGCGGGGGGVMKVRLPCYGNNKCKLTEQSLTINQTS